MIHYILDGQEIIPCDDPLEWAKWFGTADRQIALTSLKKVLISTVFLGIDHSFGLGGPPLLFETMIFGGKHDQYQDRYSTRQEAMKGHQRAVRRVKNSQKTS